MFEGASKQTPDLKILRERERERERERVLCCMRLRFEHVHPTFRMR